MLQDPRDNPTHRRAGGANVRPDIAPAIGRPAAQGGSTEGLESQENQGQTPWKTSVEEEMGKKPGGAATEEQLAQAESESFYREPGEEEETEEDGGVGGPETGSKPEGGIRGWIKKKGRKKILIGAVGFGAPLLVTAMVVLILFFLLAPFRTVHFAEVLRSAGFARFQLYMQRQYAKTIFDAAVLTDQSTGSGAQNMQGRTMLDRLRRINPTKQLIQLGNQGIMQFEFQGDKKWGGLKTTNNFVGVELYGERILLDDISQRVAGGNYNELSRADKRKVERAFGDRIAAGMNQQLATEGRAFRSEVYNGFRRLTGITMIKWPDRAREFIGLDQTKARKANLEQSLKNVDGAEARPKSGIKQIQDEADKIREERIKAIEEGRVATPGEVRQKWAGPAQVASKVSTGAFLITVACIVHDLDNSFDEAKESVPDQAARLGHDALTGGDQVKRGDVEDASAIGAEAEMWENAEQSAVYKQMVGQKVTNQEITDTNRQIPDIRGPSAALATSVGYVDDVLTVGGIGEEVGDAACPVLMNQYVQFGIAGVELAFATASAGATQGFMAAVRAFANGTAQVAAGMGLGQLLGVMMDKSVRSYAGEDYSATTAGPERFSQAAVGVDYLQQTGNRQITYGRPMTQQEASQSQSVAMDNLRELNSQKPFSERYFALSNPYSLASQTLIRIPANFASLGTGVRNSLTSTAAITLSPNNLIHSLSSIFVPADRVVKAEGGGAFGAEHGVDQHGWTDSEWNKISTDPNYDWEELAKFVEPRFDELEGKYRECYSYQRQSDRPPKCSRDFLATDEALKWRAYQFEVVAAEQSAGDVNKGDK